MAKKKGLDFMLCEKCKKRTATVFYNENINGKTRSYSLCGECAAKMRESGEMQDISSMMENFADPFTGLANSLFSGFFGMPMLHSSDEKKCPTCGTTFSEIERSGRVGCPDCYTAFHEELAGTIRSVHGTTAHIGTVPSKHRAKMELAEKIKSLKKDLKEAVEKENYESAAKLRDQIRAMENKKEGENA